MARALDSYGKRERVWRPDLGERTKLESLPCPASRPSNVPTLGTAPTSSNVDRSSNLRNPAQDSALCGSDRLMAVL